SSVRRNSVRINSVSNSSVVSVMMFAFRTTAVRPNAHVSSRTHAAGSKSGTAAITRGTIEITAITTGITETGATGVISNTTAPDSSVWHANGSGNTTTAGTTGSRSATSETASFDAKTA